MASGERDVTVFGTDRGYDREIAYSKMPDPMRNCQGDYRVASSDLLGHPAEFGRGRWVSAVGQRRHASAMIVVSDGSDENGDTPSTRVSRHTTDLIDRERLAAQ